MTSESPGVYRWIGALSPKSIKTCVYTIFTESQYFSCWWKATYYKLKNKEKMSFTVKSLYKVFYSIYHRWFICDSHILHRLPGTARAMFNWDFNGNEPRCRAERRCPARVHCCQSRQACDLVTGTRCAYAFFCAIKKTVSGRLAWQLSVRQLSVGEMKTTAFQGVSLCV